jgi:hypothetical protein
MSFDIAASKDNLVRTNGENLAPASGQGCFELHTAGSPPPTRAILDCLREEQDQAIR